MKLIVGLGNPGKAYQQTRHNIGFLVADELTKRLDGKFRNKRSVEAKISEVFIDGNKTLICKPQTFMNVSGRAVQSILSQTPSTPDDLLIVYDDADLPFGEFRLKPGGSAGGHRGMQSILDSFPRGTNIQRLRIGIGRPDHPDIPLEDWVLKKWTEKESVEIPKIVSEAADQIVQWMSK